jgi:hypothetical protein
MNTGLLITLLLAAGGAGFLFLTPQGKDILAQIRGMLSGFDTYDPQKTDLFPEGKEPANLRKEIPDFIESLKKDSDFMKGLTGSRPTSLPVINPKKF